MEIMKMFWKIEKVVTETCVQNPVLVNQPGVITQSNVIGQPGIIAQPNIIAQPGIIAQQSYLTPVQCGVDYISQYAVPTAQGTTIIQDGSVANNLANALQLLIVSNLLSNTLPCPDLVNLGVAQPALQFAQPTLQIAQPALQIAQPALQIAQPSLQFGCGCGCGCGGCGCGVNYVL
ncbi:hypothetical protein MSG28_014948 [Choristoneura fumiferana]|uniref:Uncharacterized protein n=1 Tax=Choristoneura fumiferana TaxID=7141 RepID=A0ACC0KYG5_CHOFU|nr:hypothetical protein MSG28_014948 [Choristoneura fumiferana]